MHFITISCVITTRCNAIKVFQNEIFAGLPNLPNPAEKLNIHMKYQQQLKNGENKGLKLNREQNGIKLKNKM